MLVAHIPLDRLDKLETIERNVAALLAENERLEAVGRNAADLLEQKGYDETASAVRAALDNIVSTRVAISR